MQATIRTFPRWRKVICFILVFGLSACGAFIFPTAIFDISASVIGATLLASLPSSGKKPLTTTGRFVLGVIAAVSVFIACGLGAAVSGAREIAKVNYCLSQLQQIGLAIALYADENHDRIPTSFEDLRPYCAKIQADLDKLLICPAAKDKTHPSYTLLLGGQAWLGSNENSIVATESWDNHGYVRNELYGDGHVYPAPKR